ncbi:MAG: ATP-binding protein [Methanomassiliicoccaceae archaeon]|nr:ATP-binding protein [Methanomassiliicoccaceae archaeon]
MLKRKIMDVLVGWKAEKSKKCLLLKGARQVGKTFIVREFAKQYYDNIVELNFFIRPEFKDAFEGSLLMDDLIKKITSIDNSMRFTEGRTLLFLDEVQECGNARTALKPIAEDGRFDCIASGSMLGVSYKNTRSIPVGYEKQVEMYSLDFEEYLWAVGYEASHIEHLKEYFDGRKPVPKAINDAFMEKLREYAVVGGMPSVVNIFLETKNFGLVHEEQKGIIASYLDDIAKYASRSEKPKVRKCYASVPDHLARENKRFMYSAAEKGSNAQKLENSLEWLADAGLVKICGNVTSPFFPLPAYSRAGQFKVYLTDIGILNAMYGPEMKNSFYMNTLAGPAKGGIYENLVADILLKKNVPLRYYRLPESMQEVEFLLTKGENIIPLEVKAGNGRTISLDNYITRYGPPYALKLISGNVGMNGRKLTLPLYMALFL